jgi:hypothetical protein
VQQGSSEIQVVFHHQDMHGPILSGRPLGYLKV